MPKGVELQIRGVVQGVGFRPFIYRLAHRYGYTGFVVNTGSGVTVHIDRPHGHFEEFLQGIRHESPPLARIDGIEWSDVPPENCDKFLILPSRESEKGSVIIPPDIALCQDCLRELFDPEDRRYLYPFINCTNCGPRFSIVERLPYDRPFTSMCEFLMCPVCAAEYGEPGSRRFHAQPNSCWQCGPVLTWYRSDFGPVACRNPVKRAAKALAEGKLVAIRGMGGFHLAADAASEESVQKIRLAKGRKSKPLAVMFADMEVVKKYCYVDPGEERLLQSFRRPIVLLGKKDGFNLAEGLTPGIDEAGVLLPYTPLHHLIFSFPEAPEALVMTSANYSGEPICANNRKALDSLAETVNFFLLHNRDIVNPLDDSVARIISGRTRLIRRARGYVPEPIKLHGDFLPVLACGGESKNTFCLLEKDQAFLSQHIGTLSNAEVFERYEQHVRKQISLFGIDPEIVACDLHPDYPSTRYARSLDLPLYTIQHHHAHAVAVMAEQGLTEECLAIILDGSGLGADNTVWGGEILRTDYTSYTRLACLETMPMPGGDKAAREIYRMGYAAWWLARCEDQETSFPQALQNIPEKIRAVIEQMIDKGVNSPYTSSCGRLFDSVVSLLDLRQNSDYEGQSGMELESLAYQALGKRVLDGSDLSGKVLFPVVVDDNRSPSVIRSAPMIRELLHQLENGCGTDILALEFHKWLISSICAAIYRISDSQGAIKVVLGGGCLQNTLLLRGLEISLANLGIAVHSSENLPANDGCISLGQAVIAGTMYCGQSRRQQGMRSGNRQETKLTP